MKTTIEQAFSFITASELIYQFPVIELESTTEDDVFDVLKISANGNIKGAVNITLFKNFRQIPDAVFFFKKDDSGIWSCEDKSILLDDIERNFIVINN